MNIEFFKPKEETVYEAAQLLEGIFFQRSDMFASQLDDGRYVAIKEPLTQKHLRLHLQGYITLGTYMLSSESRTQLMAFDADQENGLVELGDLSYELENQSIPAYLEVSRRGGHLWFFFEEPVDGKKARDFGNGIIRRYELDGIELYPKQDSLHGGPGSLVRLPFGKHKKSGKRYPFIHRDGVMLAPTALEQIHILSHHQNVPETAFNAYAAYGSETRQIRSLKPSRILYDSHEVERIKAAVPLVDFLSAYIDLRPVASGAIGLCPFHDDQHYSFGVNTRHNYWHCFAGCGGGDIVNFWMKWRGLEFKPALDELEELLRQNKKEIE